MSRRKVWFIGRHEANALAKGRELADESDLHFGEGMEADIRHAYQVRGIPMTSALVGPFRAPHHSVNTLALTGKLRGHAWQPGELALAHGGVLFLDDATEFRLGALAMVESAWRLGYQRLYDTVPKAIRGTGDDVMESNRLTIPTCFSLVVSTLPCPCGNRGAAHAPCPCSDRDIEKFHDKVRPLVEGAEVVRL